MENNEIKKALYRQKPNAKFLCVNKEGVQYATTIDLDGLDYQIRFLIPFSDIGDAVFFSSMESQLLIRYLIN